MKIYELHYPEKVTVEKNQQYSLAIGFFDGLHKGHQAVIQIAKQEAEKLGIQSAVMTFDPHPSHLFGDGKNKVGYITPHAEKIRILKEFGIDTLFIVRFDWSLASLTPERFIQVFIKDLGIKHVTAGFDFTFGAKGVGTMKEMASLSNGEYETMIVEKVTDNQDKISSTRIRQLLATGQVQVAAKLLGRPYRTFGMVIDGEKRGRQLGFPTANVLTQPDSILPSKGVYAVRFLFNGEVYNGVCNVGVKPTFNDPNSKKIITEVHVLNFDGDLYGKEVGIEWVEHIRDERKFESIDALAAQIGRDKEQAKQILMVDR